MGEPNLEDLEELAAPHQFALLAHEWDLLDSVVANGSQNLKNVARILTRVSAATDTYGKELQKIVVDNPPTADLEPMSKLLEMISQFITDLGAAALNFHAGIASCAQALVPTATKIDSVREATRKQSRDFQARLKSFRAGVEKERPQCLSEWQHFLRAHKTASVVEKELVAQDARANSSQKIMKLQAKQAELDQKTRLQKFSVLQRFSDFENLVKSRNDLLIHEYGPEFYDMCATLEKAQTQSMTKIVATYTILPYLLNSYITSLTTCAKQFHSTFPTSKLTRSFVAKGIRTVVADFLKTRSVCRDLEPFPIDLPCTAQCIQEGVWSDERCTFILPRKENLELQDSILSDQCGFLTVLRDNRWVRGFVRVEASELTAPDLGGPLAYLWMCKIQRLATDEMQREWCFKISPTQKVLPNGNTIPPNALTVAASSQMERDKWLFLLENVVDQLNAREMLETEASVFRRPGNNNVSDKEKEVFESIFTEDMALVKKLCHSQPSKRADVDKLAVALLEACSFESFRAVQALLRVFVEAEVASCTSDALLFRTDSVASKMFALYVRETATAWLHSALFTSVGELVLDASDDGKSFEINPTALQANLTPAEQTVLLEWAQEEGKLEVACAEEEKSRSGAPVPLPKQATDTQHIALLKVQIKNNLRRLEKAISKILDHLIDSLRYVPRKLRWMLQMVQEVVLDKFPETRWSCVSAFVFLRFLCPTVSTATLWKDSSLPTARRNLLLVTKVLQSIANRSLFTASSKEGYMNLLNPYMRTELPRVEAFCHSFIWPAPPLRDSCVSDSAACLRLRVLAAAPSFDYLHGLITDLKNGVAREDLRAPSPPESEKPAVSPRAAPKTKYNTWGSKPTTLPRPSASASAAAAVISTTPTPATRSLTRAYPPPPLPPVPPPAAVIAAATAATTTITTATATAVTTTTTTTSTTEEQQPSTQSKVTYSLATLATPSVHSSLAPSQSFLASFTHVPMQDDQQQQRRQAQARRQFQQPPRAVHSPPASPTPSSPPPPPPPASPTVTFPATPSSLTTAASAFSTPPSPFSPSTASSSPPPPFLPSPLSTSSAAFSSPVPTLATPTFSPSPDVDNDQKVEKSSDVPPGLFAIEEDFSPTSTTSSLPPTPATTLTTTTDPATIATASPIDAAATPLADTPTASAIAIAAAAAVFADPPASTDVAFTQPGGTATTGKGLWN